MQNKSNIFNILNQKQNKNTKKNKSIENKMKT